MRESNCKKGRFNEENLFLEILVLSNKPVFSNSNKLNKFHFADIKRCFVSLHHGGYCLIFKQLLNMG